MAAPGVLLRALVLAFLAAAVAAYDGNFTAAETSMKAAAPIKIITNCQLNWKYPTNLYNTRIYVGTTCTWTWQDSLTHCVKGLAGPPGFRSASLSGQGLTYSFKFTKPGTYPYNCCLHGNYMKGTIVVYAKPAPPKCKPVCNGRCWGTNHCGGTCPTLPLKVNTIAACTRCCGLYQPSAVGKCYCYAACRRIPPAKLHC